MAQKEHDSRLRAAQQQQQQQRAAAAQQRSDSLHLKTPVFFNIVKL